MRRLVFCSVIFGLIGFIFSCAHSKKMKKLLDIPTIKLEVVQDLRLKKPLEKNRPAFVSAASAIVRVGSTYYVVADDEQSLFSFHLGDRYLKPHTLLSPSLEGIKDRKAAKADFESLAYIPADQYPPNGALVAWPSGSTAQRMQAVIVPFTSDGKLGQPIVSNILPLAYELQPEARDLNIEGLLVREKKVFLFQRGNGKKSKNAIFEVSYANWLNGLQTGQWSSKVDYEGIKIGTLSGVNLTFSDVAWTKYGLLALASAEDTTSTYADGTVYGSVLVRLVGSTAEILAKFDPVAKLEGISVTEVADGLDIYMVDDSDSSVNPSRLYKTHLSDKFLSGVQKK